MSQSNPNLVLLTGATGFIGQEMLSFLEEKHIPVRAISRSKNQKSNFFKMEINAETIWTQALNGVDCILHLAGVAHKTNSLDPDYLKMLHQVNVEGTLNLARQASKVGVKRFIFLSSIGVNGDETFGSPFNEQDKPAPKTLYAQSKLEAEEGLQTLAKSGPMEIVIVRAPLVYGIGAPGNLSRLTNALEKKWPLPLAGVIDNRRSIVRIENLVDFLDLCLSHKEAANQLFLVADNGSTSTATLLNNLEQDLGCKGVIFYFPPVILRFAMRICYLEDLASKLMGDLEVDTKKARKTLSWEPKFR